MPSLCLFSLFLSKISLSHRRIQIPLSYPVFRHFKVFGIIFLPIMLSDPAPYSELSSLLLFLFSVARPFVYFFIDFSFRRFLYFFSVNITQNVSNVQVAYELLTNRLTSERIRFHGLFFVQMLLNS